MTFISHNLEVPRVDVDFVPYDDHRPGIWMFSDIFRENEDAKLAVGNSRGYFVEGLLAH